MKKYLKNDWSEIQNRNNSKTLNIRQKLTSISDSSGWCIIKSVNTTELPKTWNITNSTNDIP